MLVTASYDGEVKVWDHNGSFSAGINNFQNPVLNVSFSPANSILITGALPYVYIYDRTENGWNLVWFLEFQLYAEIRYFFAESDGERDRGKSPHSNPWFVCFWRFRIAVVVDSLWRDSTSFSLLNNLHQIINVYLPSSGKPHIQVLSGHEGEINSITWTGNKRVLISGGEDGMIKVWPIFGIHWIALERWEDESFIWVWVPQCGG